MTTVKGTILNAVSAVMGEAMKLTPDVKPDPLLTASQHVGKPYARVDGRLKATGGATYSAEHALPGLTHAALVHTNAETALTYCA